jgi:hypothetical protein
VSLRSLLVLLCAALLCLSVLCLSVLAAAQEPKAGKCTKCRGVERMPCPEHTKDEGCDEDKLEYCSVVADCTVCLGVGWTPCGSCAPQAVKDKAAAKQAQVQLRKKALAYLDEGMQRPVRKAETKHFVLVWDVDKLKVDKKMLDAHELLHLYAERLERLHTDYRALLHVDSKVFPDKSRVLVWYLPQDQERASTLYCDQGGRNAVKLMGSRPTYSVCASKQNYQNDERLHRSIIHNAAHLLMSNHNPPEWIGNKKGGWADEGFAHWWTDRYWGICDVYCFQEQNTLVEFKSGKYRLAVRQMVAANDVPPIAEIFQQNVDTLSPAMLAVSFSYVDYLLFRDAPKWNQMVRELKAKVPSREALQKVYGMSVLDFEAQWKAWVLATYPKQ